MTTPPPPEIVEGDLWYLINNLGVGLGSIPAGERVTIVYYLPPFSPGALPTLEYTVVSRYDYEDWGYDEFGNWAKIPHQRLLAYPEPDFRRMFARVEEEPEPEPEEEPGPEEGAEGEKE